MLLVETVGLVQDVPSAADGASEAVEGVFNFVSKSIRTITELGLKKSSAKLLPIGAILLSREIGRASCRERV